VSMLRFEHKGKTGWIMDPILFLKAEENKGIN